MLRPGQKPQWPNLSEGFLMGIIENAVYRTEKDVRNQGDPLMLYTDGVTEAILRRTATHL